MNILPSPSQETFALPATPIFIAPWIRRISLKPTPVVSVMLLQIKPPIKPPPESSSEPLSPSEPATLVGSEQ